MFTISKDANENYLSKIVRVENIRKHSNADALQIVSINGTPAIVDLSVKLGDIMVFVATESKINQDFLKCNNLFADKLLNEDTEMKGYVNNKGRVKTIKLRGEYSRAFLLPVSTLEKFLGKHINLESYVGKSFDTVEGILFSEKYCPPTKGGSCEIQVRNKELEERLIPDQFKFHVDTHLLADNYKKIDPDSYIQITKKYHGTSGIASCVLVNKKLNWFEKFIYKFFNLPMTEYACIASSRKVVRKIERFEQVEFYSTDVWSWALDNLKPYLQKGLTVYFEIIGYVPNSQSFIQNGYDYGLACGDTKLLVYRVTYTSPTGEVFEFSSQQVKEWCKRNSLVHVKELYYGKFKDFCSENILEYLSTYDAMEQKDPECKNKVPFEGLVVRVDNWKDIEAYKLKSEKFYLHESEMLDADYVGLE